MSIKDFIEKIKDSISSKKLYFSRISDDTFYTLLILLVAIGSFGLGRLSKLEGTKHPVRIENIPTETAPAGTGEKLMYSSQGASVIGSITSDSKDMQLVGSKSGTKYHYAWCSGAQRISEANKIYFASKADAEAKGYTPASNCKGL